MLVKRARADPSVTSKQTLNEETNVDNLPVPTPIEKNSTHIELDNISDNEPWESVCEPNESLSDYIRHEPDASAKRDQIQKPNMIARTSVPIRSNSSQESNLSSKEKIDIGRWGEEKAFSFIIDQISKKHPTYQIVRLENVCSFISNEQTIIEIIWENCPDEVMLPYDIKLVEPQKTTYYEVKSTPSSNKNWFRISGNQWALAMNELDNFHILRIFNAGKPKGFVEEYVNLYQLWLDGKVSGYPLRIQL